MRILLLVSIMLMGMYSYGGVVVLDQNGQGDYTIFTDAFNNTSVNDTIYVVGSAASYGNIVLSSPRTILGNGYFGQSLGYLSSAIFGTITLNAGSSGARFIGVTISTATFNESNVSFISCYFTGISTIGASITSVSYAKCYFSSTLTIQGSGVIIENSIFNYVGAGNVLTVTGGVEAQLEYNTFYDGNLALDTAMVTNCIVNNSRVTQTPSIIVDSQFGNKVDTETNLLFDTSKSNDRFFQPQAGSSALTSSDSGGESGAFGFPAGQPEFAYVLSGLPDIPRIIGLEFGSSSNSSNNLSITIQATSN